MNHPISITAIASISPLGSGPQQIWARYGDDAHALALRNFNGETAWVAPLREAEKKQVELLRKSDSHYKELDDSVLYAILAARRAVAAGGWSAKDNFGVNIGSSRGATALFEAHHGHYLKEGTAATLSSPTTTLGNISSWVAHDLGTKGPEISHSITCSTALHAFLNGVAWLRAQMAHKFLVGGSEAPLTPFTMAQMKALKIYAAPPEGEGPAQRTKDRAPWAVAPDLGHGRVAERSGSYPCQALNLDKKTNTMVLGEGAAMACLEMGVSEKSLAVVHGVGFGTELLSHNVSLSANAVCFQRSMAMALGDVPPHAVDVIVMHAPGTLKGDRAEANAIKRIFGADTPFLTTNKWKLGHTFGASGMLSLELAVLMLQHQKAIKVPFVAYAKEPQHINRVLVNAVGFGGNAVSILLAKVPL
jgi:3-oxoacyl-[acyl-carrier-protein] synthase II